MFLWQQVTSSFAVDSPHLEVLNDCSKNRFLQSTEQCFWYSRLAYSRLQSEHLRRPSTRQLVNASDLQFMRLVHETRTAIL